MTQPDTADTADLEIEGGETDRSLGRMLLGIAESEGAEFEHERIAASVRQKLFGLGAPLHIGAYVVTRRLGAGGMGEVYECRDPQLDRKVAIKLVRGSADEHDQDRLLLEAKSMAKLADPNVVMVFEVGRSGGRTFIVMEYVRGQTLARWLRSGPAWRAVLDHFLAAGRGLAAAHRAGLVHRDFKPDNVLLGQDGAVKVADFGLAITERQRSRSAVPGTGSAAGTTRYMPLEQLAGAALDARSDQFAFCSALYEGLWGELPFVDTDRGVPKPPKRSHGLWPLVRRGLAREPSERWPSMDALLVALERVPKRARRIGWSLTGALASACLGVLVVDARADRCEAVSHELAGVWDPSRRAELERHLATIEAEAAHARDSSERVLAGLDAWSSSWLIEREHTCRDHEDRLGERARVLAREACLDRQREHVGQLVDTLDHADGTTLAEGVIVLAELPAPSICADAVFSPIEAPPPAQALRIKGIRRELDHATQLRRLGQLEQGLELARAIDGVARTLDYGPVQAETRAELAKAENVAGAPERSAVLYDQAIDLAEIHHHDRLAAQLWIERAQLSLFGLREPERGQQLLHRAEIAQARVGSPDVRTQARLAFNRARVAELGHEPEAAQAGYREALELARTIESVEVPSYANSLARVVDSREDSLALRRDAVEFAEAHWGATHPRTAEPLLNLGLALNDAGLGGEPELTRAAAIWIEVHGHPHPRLGEAYLVLARAAIQGGELDLAETHAFTLAAIQHEVLPEHDPARGEPEQLLATIEGVRGNHEAALAHALRARAWFERADPGAPRTLAMGREAANHLIALGRLDEADDELDRVLQQIGDDPAQALQTRMMLAELALRRGQLDDADAQLCAIEALALDQPDQPDQALIYAILRALVDHRRGRLDPAQVERVRVARPRSRLSEEQLGAWFDELELPADERRLFQ